MHEKKSVSEDLSLLIQIPSPKLHSAPLTNFYHFLEKSSDVISYFTLK